MVFLFYNFWGVVVEQRLFHHLLICFSMSVQGLIPHGPLKHWSWNLHHNCLWENCFFCGETFWDWVAKSWHVPVPILWFLLASLIYIFSLHDRQVHRGFFVSVLDCAPLIIWFPYFSLLPILLVILPCFYLVVHCLAWLLVWIPGWVLVLILGWMKETTFICFIESTRFPISALGHLLFSFAGGFMFL